LIAVRAAITFAKIETLPEKHEMTRAEGSDDRAIRVPANIVETVNWVVRTARQMLPEIGREPTLEELA
jgi:RNA polymerase primary sigma factor